MRTQHCQCPLKHPGHKPDRCKGDDLFQLGHVQGVGETTFCRQCLILILRAPLTR